MKISMIPNNQVKLIHASKGDTSLRKWNFEPYDSSGEISVADIKDQLVYYTENGGTEQLLPVNTSTPATSFFDGTINYGTDTDVEFTYKQSDYTGQARIKSIKGNTLVWNQLVSKGNMTDGWTFSNSTGSYSNNILTFTASAQGGFVRPTTPQSIIAGHKYVGKVSIKGTSSFTGRIAWDGRSEGFQEASVTTSWQTFSFMFTNTVTEANYYPRVYDLRASGWDAIQVQNCMLIDITQMFGSNEPITVDEFTSLFPLPYYAYNSGSLLNFNGTGIKTTGKNLWNNSIASVTSQVTKTGSGAVFNAFSSGVEILNFAIQDYGRPPFSDIDYTISFYAYADISGTTLRFDGQPDALYNAYSGNALGKDKQFALSTTRTRYTYSGIVLEGNTGFRFFRTTGDVNSSTSKVYIEDIQLEFGSIATDYDPYTTSTTSLPISTYFPTGMKSAGNVYDELSDKAITRVGSRAYQSGDESDTSVITDGTTTYYALATYTEQDIKTASLVCKNIETPCYLSNGELVCDATEELTSESGFFDAKLKLKDSNGVAYSSKFKLHVEDL